jgi:hypothetical protein
MIIHHDQVCFIPGIQGWFNISKSINVIQHINRSKDKNYVIISIDVEKHLTRPNTNIIHDKTSIEGFFFNLTMNIYKTTIANNLLKGKKPETLLLNQEPKSYPSSPLLFNTIFILELWLMQ